jgi:hypothetical protein
MAVFGLLADVFRSDDLSGWGKAAWVLLVIVLPIIGIIIYLGVRGDRMSQHARDTVSRQDMAYLNYARQGR